jgi:hypothetical protein
MMEVVVTGFGPAQTLELEEQCIQDGPVVKTAMI